MIEKLKKYSLVITVVGIILSFIGGAFIGPYMQAAFTADLTPRPDLEILNNEYAFVPLGGTNWVFCKILVKNNGQEAATPLNFHVEVNSPYVVGPEDKTYADFNLGGIRSGQALMVTFKVTNTQETVEHGSLTINARVESLNSWDEFTSTDSW